MFRLSSSSCWSRDHPWDARRSLPRVDEHLDNPSARAKLPAEHRKSRSRGSPWWGQGPAVCLWSNTRTAITDCLVYTGPRQNHSRDGDRSAQKALRAGEALQTLCLQNHPPALPPASLSRGGSFKITVVSRGGMRKGKEKYYRMGMWLFQSS